ncbi:hypothetical protein CCH79_00020349 [Gambusia affinis]|uniref:Uncharacterized protein n=1 Tax=Gambusia affinis TaxID=33528 RepID=A0A315VBG3_GAMAF|nr:hypothetical protein CCH79_00020349 [Gambusia affinis]
MSMASPIDLPLVGPASSSLSAAERKLPFLRQQLHSVVSPSSVMVESVDEAEGLYVAVERCPLCTTSRRRLTCARCIQAGDFVFFDGRNNERYSEKWGRLQKLEEEKERLQQSVLRVMGRRLQADEMKWKIMLFKKRRDQLKEAVAWGNEEVKSYRELLLRSQEETQRLQRRAGRHQEKRDKIDRHNCRLVELLERRSREQHNKLSQLAALRRDHIQELIMHIFHMQEEKQSSRDLSDVTEVDLALTSSTVTELAEARRTTYLSGRWIWDDQNGETSISITGTPVVLPSNGDCSAYYSWVEEKSTSSGPEIGEHDPVFFKVFCSPSYNISRRGQQHTTPTINNVGAILLYPPETPSVGKEPPRSRVEVFVHGLSEILPRPRFCLTSHPNHMPLGLLLPIRCLWGLTGQRGQLGLLFQPDGITSPKVSTSGFEGFHCDRYQQLQ